MSKRIDRTHGTDIDDFTPDHAKSKTTHGCAEWERDVERLRAVLTEIQTMTRAFVEANNDIRSASVSKAFWRIAHVEKIAREALEGE